MKKLLRFLIILVASSVSTQTYAMTDQKSVQAEQKIPHIKAETAENLGFEIRTKLLTEGFSPESIVAAIKKQQIDVNAGEPYYPYSGWSALLIQVYYLIIKKDDIPMRELTIQVLLDAGADIKAQTIDNGWNKLSGAPDASWNNLTALEMLTKYGEGCEKLKTWQLLISRGADTSRVMGIKAEKLKAMYLGHPDKEEVETLADVLQLASLS